jgi:hypothetical protein
MSILEHAAFCDCAVMSNDSIEIVRYGEQPPGGNLFKLSQRRPRYLSSHYAAYHSVEMETDDLDILCPPYRAFVRIFVPFRRRTFPP